MRCSHKILRISYKDHVTNEEICAMIHEAVRPHEDLTIIKRRKPKRCWHVSRSSGLARTILQGTVKWGRRQGRQRKRWEDNIRDGQAWSRAVENRKKSGGNWLWNHPGCLNDPRSLRDRWRWGLTQVGPSQSLGIKYQSLTWTCHIPDADADALLEFSAADCEQVQVWGEWKPVWKPAAKVGQNQAYLQAWQWRLGQGELSQAPKLSYFVKQCTGFYCEGTGFHCEAVTYFMLMCCHRFSAATGVHASSSTHPQDLDRLKAFFLLSFFFLTTIVLLGFFPREIWVNFPRKSQLQQSHATQPTVHTGCFRVSIIHGILTWTIGSLTCTQTVMHAIACGSLQTP